MKKLLLAAMTVALGSALVAQIGITTRVSQGNGLQTNDDTNRMSISANNRFVVFESIASNIVTNDGNGASDIFLHDRLEGTTERVSLTSTGTQSNGDSYRPDVSADGRYIVFQSAASNLVPGDTNAAYDIFVRDRQAQNTLRASISTASVQGNGASTFGVISDDGAYVAFTSAATNLVASDTNGETDAFRHSLASGTTIRVSLTVNSTQCNGDSTDVAINEDGDFIAFSSDATNLIVNDTNGAIDVFRREISNPSTAIMSRHTNGTIGNDNSRSPSISANGQVVAFRSAATNLVSGDTNAVDDVFVRNVGVVTTVRASTSSSNVQGNAASVGAAVSSDGNFIAFQSDATNLVASDTNGLSDVFRKDLQSGALARVSVSSLETQGNGSSLESDIGDGSEVAFLSSATNMLLGDGNAATDGFVRNVGGGTTALVTETSGEGNASSLNTDSDYAGRIIAFSSDAETLVFNDTNAYTDVFVLDRLTRAMSRVSISSAGIQSNGDSRRPSVSADGRLVAFESEALNLVTGDNNLKTDIFVRDRQLGTTTRVSVSSAGVQANDHSSEPRISADGRYVAFVSAATNLVINDTNQTEDVFVHDRVTGVTTRESVGPGGVEANSNSTTPALSSDGSFIVFASFATNLIAGDTNGQFDIFRRNRSSGAISAASVSSSEVLSNNNSNAPDVSADGNLVVFASVGTNLVAGDTNSQQDIFLRNFSSGTTTRLSLSTAGAQGNGPTRDPFINVAGSHVAFESSATNLVVGDTNGVADIFVREVGAFRTYRVSVSTAGAQANGLNNAYAISADGLASFFTSGANNLIPIDLNSQIDVFVNDPRLTPDLFTIVRGVVESGDHGSAFFSDDDRIIIRPGITFTTSQAPIEMVAECFGPLLSPARIDFAVEFHATSPSIRQTIELFNFDTSLYEVVDVRQATVSDSVVLVNITSNPGRFVSSSRLMRSRVSHKASGPVFAYPWRSRIDHVRWSVF